MKNIKYLICILVGIVLTIGISSAYILNASLVTYDNKNTTLESENVSGALNELGVLATTKLSEIENEINEFLKVDETSITLSVSGNTILSSENHLRKNNHVVTFDFYIQLNTGLAAKTLSNIGIIPLEYRPKNDLRQAISCSTSDHIVVIVKADGTVSLFRYPNPDDTGSASQIFGNITWIV